MFIKSRFQSRAIDIQLENLTSRSGAISQRENKVISLTEINSSDLTITFSAPSTFCAHGHHLRLVVCVMDAAPPVTFKGTGTVKDVSADGAAARIEVRLTQVDQVEWKKLNETLDSTFARTQALFKMLKE